MSIETRPVPGLGRTVTRLGLGALPMGPLQRGLSVEEGARVVRAAAESGITFVDTATIYGTQPHVGAGLVGFDDVVVSTKTHARDDRALAEQHIAAALSDLKRERIDIMLCHCARDPYTDAKWGPTLEALLAARDRGDIGIVGVSSHSVEGVRVAARHPDIQAIHPLLNMRGLGITDGTAADMVDAIREAKAAGKFIYGMKALGGGNLVPTRREALRFVLDVAEVDTIALGMVNERELEWNLAFVGGEAIADDLDAETAMHSKRLNILSFICTGCGSCVEHCENDALSIEEGKAVVDAERCILCAYCAPHCPQFAIRVI
jgi:uncharacterized protein